MAHLRSRAPFVLAVLATAALVSCAGSKKDGTGPDDDPTVDLIPLAKGAT
jgi:hypothetical protein